MSTNGNERVSTDADYLARRIALEGERRSLAEDDKELTKQMKDDGKSPLEIRASKRAAKRHYEDGDAAERREALEAEIQRQLGEYANTPLGRAAVGAAGERVAAE